MKNTIKKYKTPLITILLGALGSALWSFISTINSYFSNIVATYFINISTYFDEKIFTQVAQNDSFFLQQSISSTTSLIICIISIIFAMSVSVLVIFVDDSITKEQAEVKKLGYKYNIEKDLNDKNLYTKEEFINKYDEVLAGYEKIKNKLKLLKQIFKFLAPILFISIIITFAFNTLQNRYIIDSIQYFNYLLKVNSAYLNTDLEREYISRFSQIRTGEDYREIVVELEKLALGNKLHFRTNLNIRSEEDIHKDHPGVMFEE